MTRITSPGKDEIQNRIMKSLDDASLATLSQHLNRVWESGKIRVEWKYAEIVLIPKLG